MVNNRLMDFQEKLKEVFSTQGMPALHNSFKNKTKWPGLNLFRQTCRRVGIDLKPVIVSAGQERGTGKKKVARYFEVTPMPEGWELTT